MNIKLIKLTTGEDVVCNIVNEDDNHIEIEQGIVPVPGAGGNVGFIPFAALQKKGETITISKNFVVYITEPAEEIVKQLEQIINPSAVVTPPKKSLIL